MKIDEDYLDYQSFNDNGNVVKEIVLQRLFNDKIISEEQKIEYNEKWQVITFKYSWFKTWWKKYNNQKGDYGYKFLKFED